MFSSYVSRCIRMVWTLCWRSRGYDKKEFFWGDGVWLRFEG